MSSSVNGTNGNYLKATSSLPALQNNWSFCIWCAQTQPAAFAVGVSLETAGAGNFTQFYAGNNNRQESYTSDAGVDTNFPGGLFTNGEWNFYCASHTQGTNTILYRGVNGAALSTTTISGDSHNWVAESLTLFNENANDEPLNGNVLNFIFWTGVALSAREVANQYLSMRPIVRVSSIERWVPVIDNGNPGQAYMGLSKNLTKTGTLSASRSMPSIPYGVMPFLMTG